MYLSVPITTTIIRVRRENYAKNNLQNVRIFFLKKYTRAAFARDIFLFVRRFTRENAVTYSVQNTEPDNKIVPSS